MSDRPDVDQSYFPDLSGVPWPKTWLVRLWYVGLRIERFALTPFAEKDDDEPRYTTAPFGVVVRMPARGSMKRWVLCAITIAGCFRWVTFTGALGWPEATVLIFCLVSITFMPMFAKFNTDQAAGVLEKLIGRVGKGGVGTAGDLKTDHITHLLDYATKIGGPDPDNPPPADLELDPIEANEQ